MAAQNGRVTDNFACRSEPGSSSGIAWAKAWNDCAKAKGERRFELCIGARAGVPVGAPAVELGGVTEPFTFHMVVADLDHPLGVVPCLRRVRVRAGSCCV